MAPAPLARGPGPCPSTGGRPCPPAGRPVAASTRVTIAAMETQAVVRARGLRKRYGGATAVGGVDLTVQRGEVFAVLGPNAAGNGELTVDETISHFAGYYPNPYRPAEVIARVGLTAKARARVRTLSGG